MNAPYKLNSDDDSIEIPADKSLTLLVHPGEMNLSSNDDRLFTIDAERTVAFTRTIPQDDWLDLRDTPVFRELFAAVWDEFDSPIILEKSSLAVKHIVGLICLTLTAIFEGKTPFIQLPETYLHPKQQVRLVTMLNMLQNPKTFGSESTATA